MRNKICVDCLKSLPLRKFYLSKSRNYRERFCLPCRYIRYKDKSQQWVKGKKYHKITRKNQPWKMHLDAARQRCNYKNNCNFKYYGKKGIKCSLTIDEIRYLWYRGQAALMKKPSIDRKNSNKNYTFQIVDL